jgi:hypothetical protein
MNRDDAIVAIRPQIPNLDVDAEGSEVLHFQNTILRQIIKFQHELIIAVSKRFLHLRKLDFNSIDFEQRKLSIQRLFLRDKELKTSMEGLVIGCFTVEEYGFFCQHEQEIRRRIRDIIKNRIWDSMDQLA